MKKSFIVTFFLAMVLFGITPFINAASAATYYVSPSGNDSNSGSQSAPFQTIQQAANIVNPGDTVIVGDGTYTANNTGSNNGATVWISRSGSSGSPITFKSQNKWGAIIDGQSNYNSYNIAIASGTHDINLEGFRLQNAEYVGIDAQWGGNSNINVYNNNIGPIGSDGGGQCGGNGGAAIVFNYAQHNITVDSNIAHDIGGSSSSCGTHYSLIHGIDFEYNTAFSNITVINNICYNNIYGWDMQFYSDSSTSPNNISIIGNTFASTNGAGDAGQIILAESVGNPLIEDNIFYHAGNGVAVNYSGSNFIANNNLTTGSSMGSGWTGSNNILNKDPLFANPSDYNFQLQSGSPAIGTGLAWSGRTYDASGNTLPGTPDIGAFEYMSSASTSISGTSNTGSTSTSGTTSSTGSTSTSGTTSIGSTTLPNNSTNTVTISTGTSSTGSNVTSGNTALTNSTSSSGTTSTTLSHPDPIAPSNGTTTGTTVTFQWKKVNGNVNYQILLSKDSQFASSQSVNVASASNTSNPYAGAAGILLFGIAFSSGLRKRKKLLLLLAGMALSAMMLVSCGGGGGSSAPQSSSGATATSTSATQNNAVSYTVSGLSSSTTYYWKVVATDNTGQQVTGQAGTFTTN